jgi:hypothetical protein
MLLTAMDKGGTQLVQQLYQYSPDDLKEFLEHLQRAYDLANAGKDN